MVSRIEALSGRPCKFVHEERSLPADAIRLLSGVAFADHLVVGADVPLEVIGKLCQLGLRPVYPEMEHIEQHDAPDTERDGRQYRFKRFRLVEGIHQQANGEWQLSFAKQNVDNIDDDASPSVEDALV